MSDIGNLLLSELAMKRARRQHALNAMAALTTEERREVLGMLLAAEEESDTAQKRAGAGISAGPSPGIVAKPDPVTKSREGGLSHWESVRETLKGTPIHLTIADLSNYTRLSKKQVMAALSVLKTKTKLKTKQVNAFGRSVTGYAIA